MEYSHAQTGFLVSALTFCVFGGDYMSKQQIESVDDKDKKLTQRQKAFVEAYLSNGFNVQGAGRIAHPTCNPKSLAGWAWTTFRLPHVQAEIERRKEQVLHDMGFNKEHLIQEWMRLANADASDFVEWELRYDEQTQTYTPIIRMKPSSEVDGACIKSVKIGRTGKIEFELYDKTTALKQVGEIMGVYPKTSQVEITGKDGNPIQIEEVKNKLLDKLNKMAVVAEKAVNTDVCEDEHNE